MGGGDYAAWKGWSAPFRVSVKQRRYFEGEIGRDRVRGKKVLEIGFGEGGFMAWCRENGAEVFGIETLSEMVEAGREQGFPTFLAEAFPWEEHAGTFDLVVALDVLEHLDLGGVSELLGRVEAAAAPGGLQVFRFPNGQSPFGGIFQYGDVTHQSVLSGPILGQLCREIELRPVATRKPYFPIRDRALLRSPLRPLRRLLDVILERLLLWGVARGLGVPKYVLSPIVVVFMEKGNKDA
jgi:hypothetical protein